MPELTAKGLLRWIVPAAVADAARRREQLRQRGAPPVAALTTALSRRRWNALENSRLGLLPYRELRKLQAIVDVGANEGGWSRDVLHLSNPQYLLCIEPSSEVVTRLRERLSRLPQAHVLHAAAGSESGEATLNLTAHSHNSSLVQPTALASEILGKGMFVTGTETVQVVRLDEVVPAGPVSLLKIDTQGYERSCLDGASRVLERTRWVLIEALIFHQYEDDMLLAEVDDYLTDRGFELWNFSAPLVRRGRAVFTDLLYRAAR